MRKNQLLKQLTHTLCEIYHKEKVNTEALLNALTTAETICKK